MPKDLPDLEAILNFRKDLPEGLANLCISRLSCYEGEELKHAFNFVRRYADKAEEVASLLAEKEFVSIIENKGLIRSSTCQHLYFNTRDLFIVREVINKFDYYKFVESLDKAAMEITDEEIWYKVLGNADIIKKYAKESKEMPEIFNHLCFYQKKYDKDIVLGLLTLEAKTELDVFKSFSNQNEDRIRKLIDVALEYMKSPFQKNVCDLLTEKSESSNYDLIADFYMKNFHKVSVNVNDAIKFVDSDYTKSLEKVLDIFGRTDADRVACILSEIYDNHDMDLDLIIDPLYLNCDDEILDAIEIRIKNFQNIELDSLADYKEQIQKSKNRKKTIDRVISGTYDRYSKRIGMYLECEDLDLVVDTSRLVQEIHSSRLAPDMAKIENGFFDELNRSIHQVNGYENKLKNLRIYCREVKQKIRNEAEELMLYA